MLRLRRRQLWPGCAGADGPTRPGAPRTPVAGGEALSQQTMADVAYAFEDAVVQTFVIKCRRALQATGLNTLVIAGGVSANISLRAGLQAMVEKQKAQLFYAQPRFCTDNGAMIAYAGAQRLAAGEHDGLALNVKARWPLASLPPLLQASI